MRESFTQTNHQTGPAGGTSTVGYRACPPAVLRRAKHTGQRFRRLVVPLVPHQRILGVRALGASIGREPSVF